MKVRKIINVDVTIESATLLSIEEAETLLTEEERTYAEWWWLRSPGRSSADATYVRSDGSVSYLGSYVNGVNVIRPALKIANLESSNFKMGDRFELGGQTFKIISNNFAFCEGDIGYGPFRKKWNALDANDYNASDVKKIVDGWFQDNIS